MEAEKTLPANKSEDEEYEECVYYGVEMHQVMAPIVKKFLVDYFGELMYNLESETYREIDKIINDAYLFGDDIPADLRKHRTIKDEDLWKEASDNFNRKDAKFAWQRKPQWYDKVYANDNDEESLEDIPESELTKEQKIAKKVFECADNIIDFHIGFSAFMKQGCDLLIPAMQKYMENTISFELSILSPEGYELVQNDLEGIAANLFDPLYMILQE